MRRFLVATLTFSLIASCGGSDGESESSVAEAPNESNAAGETDEPTQDVAADTAAAEAALLTLSDFPAGWSEVPSEEDDGSGEELQERARECLGADTAELFSGEALAETGDFTDPADDSTVSQSVNIAATVELAESFIAGGAADGVAECLTALYREEFPKLLAEDETMDGVEVGEVTVGALNVGEIGEDGFAYRVTVPFSFEGFSVDAVLDIVAARVGRSASLMEFGSTLEPTSIERITEYSALAASRLPA